MSTAKRLQIMLIITTLFGLSSIGAIIQLSKATKLHHMNFMYMTNASELNEELDSHIKVPLNTERIIKKLETLKKIPLECLSLINWIDRSIAKYIHADDMISLCTNDKLLIEQLLEDLYSYNEETINDPVLVDSLVHSTYVFTRNSRLLEVPVETIGAFTIKMAFWLLMPFSIFIVIFSIFIFNRIKQTTARLKDVITALETSEEEKRTLAYYDPLTSLPNRNLFSQIFEHELNQVNRYKHAFALMFIDLDRFKFINDTLGHDAGDNLIKQVSERLKTCTRKSDTLARFGGDEFVLILTGKHAEKDVQIVAEKILAEIAQPFILDGHEMHISASVGITYCPKDGVDSRSLLKRADIAMYEAKTNGKNQYYTYEENSINSKTEHRLELEKDLRKAIERNELVLYYQPVINLNNYRSNGAEALIRWQHKEKGMIMPDEFIPIAEEAGMIIDIGEWVIDQACQQCKAWRELGQPDYQIAVNVSALQLKNNKLPQYISNRLNYYSLPSSALDVEITESTFYGEDANSKKNLNEISNIGVRLLLDDFGTGYSSLSSLHGMPFNVIKIDRQFMDIQHPKKRIMTQTIIDMAKNFGMCTLAEGVEDQAAVDFLYNNGCEYVQGYYFQRPAPAEELNVNRDYSAIVNASNVTAFIK